MAITAFNSDYMTVVQNDASAALMLSQIVYWYLPTKKGQPKLKIQRDGFWWIAKSYLEWEGEIGLTYEQARRCIRLLTRCGIIERRVVKFAGSPTIHLRLKVAASGRMLKSPPTAQELRPCPAGEHSSICAGGQNDVCSATDSSVHLHSSFTENTELTTEESTKGGQAMPADKDKKTPEEILVVWKKVKEENPEHQNFEFVAEYWRAKLYEGGLLIVLPFTKMQMRMFKKLNHTLGTDRSLEAIEYAFSNWWKFITRVRCETGYKKNPTCPQLEIVAQYRSILESMLSESDSIAKPTHDEVVIAPVFDIGTPIPKIVKEKGYKPTPEEIAKLKATFG